MERRDGSLKALKELVYIDSLDGEEKARAVSVWASDYLIKYSIKDFSDLSTENLKKLEELLYKNIVFLKKEKDRLKSEMDYGEKLKKFLS